MILKTRNLLENSAPQTFLTTAGTVGATSLAVKNTAGFTNQYAVQLGKTGEEQSEVVIGTVSDGTTLTCAALSFAHGIDTPITSIKYDKIIFERSTAGTAGTATPIGTVAYQADGTVTQYEDTTGDTTYAYKTRYYNSATLGSTSQSDWITSAGFSFYSLASIRSRIKKKLWSSSYIKDDDTIDEWVNEWKDEMSNAVISVNQDYALGTVDVAFGTNGLGTITTGDYKQLRRMEVTFDSTNYYLSTKRDTNTYPTDEVLDSTHPFHNWEGDNIFRVKPSSTAGTARLTFYRFGTTMVNDTDELPVSMRSYTKSFVDYGQSQALFKDQKLAEAQTKMLEANASKRDFINNIVPRDQSGPTYITITSSTSADDDIPF